MPDINLDQLNSTQREAVEYTDGVSLVIAGAGSGKTRVLTYKIAYLLSKGYKAYNILALTFTNKAAEEMKQRIENMVGSATASRLWMGTFHSVFLKILRPNADRLGFPHDFTIYDKDDSKSLIRSIIKEKQLDDKLYKPKTISSIISSAKNALITPLAYASNREIVEGDIRSKRPAIKDIYAIYGERCRRAGAMDFDDILLYTNILFRDNPDILEHYGNIFGYILVDEYQDVNFSQHLAVKQLMKYSKRLCVVGDDAQSIYSFRGANIQNILNLKSEYADCRIFKLEQNYRSTQMIVNAANSLISKNKGQIQKKIFSNNKIGEAIKILNACSDFEEGYMVAASINEIRYRTGGDYNSFAILYRTNAQSRIFEEALRKRNIPYRIYGGMSFYQRKEIKDVLAYLRLVTNNVDEEALKRIINYPARGIGDTTITKIGEAATQHKVSLWNIINSPIEYAVKVNSGTVSKLLAFRDIIIDLKQKAEEKNAADFTEYLIRRTGILADVYTDRMPENLSRQENIQELLNGIVEFCSMREESGESTAITDFLSEVSLASDQDNGDEEDVDKVTLMTVHSAKGLEYKNVFVVGLEEDLFPSAMSKDSPKEIEEERRLLYVAITRAQENCVLSYSATRYRNGQTVSSPPSRFLSDIDPRFTDNSRLTTTDIGHGRSIPGNTRRVISPVTIPDTKMLEKERIIRSGSNFKPVTEMCAKSTEKISTPTGDKICIGVEILHERFGKGTILSVTDSGDNCKIEVEFINVGKKTLLLKFAKFTILK